MDKKVLVPVLLLIVGLVAGFGGGYFLRNFQLTQARAGFAAGGANGFQRFTGTRTGGGSAGRNATVGSILSMDSNSITVKLVDGSSKIVILSGSTTYSNTVTATSSDLKTGENVAVVGTPNSDGSVTATNVQINPAYGRPMGSPMPAPIQ